MAGMCGELGSLESGLNPAWAAQGKLARGDDVHALFKNVVINIQQNAQMLNIQLDKP